MDRNLGWRVKFTFLDWYCILDFLCLYVNFIKNLQRFYNVCNSIVLKRSFHSGALHFPWGLRVSAEFSTSGRLMRQREKVRITYDEETILRVANSVSTHILYERIKLHGLTYMHSDWEGSWDVCSGGKRSLWIWS